jgi:beta-glucosidase
MPPATTHPAHRSQGRHHRGAPRTARARPRAAGDAFGARGLSLGIVINPSNVRSEGSPDAPEDQMSIVDGIHNRWWFDSILKGEYPADLMRRLRPLAEAVQPGDLELINQPLDWMGINYYFDILVAWLGSGEASNRMAGLPHGHRCHRSRPS